MRWWRWRSRAADPVQKISIIPRGIGALGYTMQRPTEDRFLMSRQELEDRMAVLLGGRAAEMLLGEDVSTGAADDLAKATDIARGMVLRFGMDEKLGPVAWDTEQGQFLGDRARSGGSGGSPTRPRTRSTMRCARIWKRALARAVGILRANRAALDEGAAALLAHEVLNADELPKVLVQQPAKAAE